MCSVGEDLQSCLPGRLPKHPAQQACGAIQPVVGRDAHARSLSPGGLDSRCPGRRSCGSTNAGPASNSKSSHLYGRRGDTDKSVSQSLVLSLTAGRRFHQTRQFTIPPDAEGAGMTNWCDRYVHDELCPRDLTAVDALALSEPSILFDPPSAQPPTHTTVPSRGVNGSSSRHSQPILALAGKYSYHRGYGAASCLTPPPPPHKRKASLLPPIQLRYPLKQGYCCHHRS
ncbi:hypothetical protein LZ31DRAFT_269221 [Colletotrichum somersetense]|nr:hypothetical protein LZ31DRAFT_269221 [Colletotrichum somersetense]